MAVQTKHRLLFTSEPTRIQPLPNVMNIHRIHNFRPYKFKYGERVARFQELDIYDDKYQAIEKLFDNPYSNLLVDRVVKVYNPYLKKEFELKRNLHYRSGPHLELFHGTKDSYVDSICEYNFDLRYSGDQSDKFGKGIYFATDPSFASISCDQGPDKVIILAEVLVKNTCKGNKDLVVPSRGCDTAVMKTAEGSIYVKFDDNEFYPSCIIHCVSKEY